ncbi:MULTISPECIES: type II toxin-antitoxin system RelE/ParE family toxin [Flavobacterium]|jgi:plasmid stabilization system protein ParE|nr:MULTISPECIES: type II toxin-antitoxin system RelE/ParE family toxin [Flavobacterium]OXE96717.1 plasmid stabilization protein [Flavobacterium johnsoniae UW101]WDF61249.1 type II toxin-antitoxin system RelE/ParE family toxin [Flavobacterium sp. KACC 22758]WQG82645.1 type II toxin-antitoxin system RelE/ParE family toxin [Flavobacterium johnsoniae UW101]SHL53982.1 ParE toxin of type II toxin-antitoxin system, parDE [Flavobacterium johnsoniae]
MKVSFTEDFMLQLKEQIKYIAKDKPIAARKFKKDLLKNIKKDLVNPFYFKKSIYFDEEKYRDYVFKGYTAIIRIESELEIVYIIGFLKHNKLF